MVRINTIIVLAGFISISVFGLFLMPYDGSHHDMFCLASVVNNTQSPCPENDPLGFANFHNNAIKKISNLALVDNLAVLLGIIMMMLVGSFLLSVLRNIYRSDNFVYFRSHTAHYLLLATSLFWFSLHENSPSFSGRMI